MRGQFNAQSSTTKKDLNNFANGTWICALVDDSTPTGVVYSPLKIVAVKETVRFGSIKFKNIIFENTKIF